MASSPKARIVRQARNFMGTSSDSANDLSVAHLGGSRRLRRADQQLRPSNADLLQPCCCRTDSLARCRPSAKSTVRPAVSASAITAARVPTSFAAARSLTTQSVATTCRAPAARKPRDRAHTPFARLFQAEVGAARAEDRQLTAVQVQFADLRQHQ